MRLPGASFDGYSLLRRLPEPLLTLFPVKETPGNLFSLLFPVYEVSGSLSDSYSRVNEVPGSLSDTRFTVGQY